MGFVNGKQDRPTVLYQRRELCSRQTLLIREVGFSLECYANSGSKLSNVLLFLQYRTSCSLFNKSCNQLPKIE